MRVRLTTVLPQASFLVPFAAVCATQLGSCLLTTQLDDLTSPTPDSSTDSGGGTCGASRADCNMNPEDGCESNTTSDKKNCGWCGHDCRGSECTQGLCHPAVFADNTGTGSLAQDDTAVYWSNSTSGIVESKSKDETGTRRLIASGQGSPAGIAVDDEAAYWTNRKGSTVMRAVKNDSSGGLTTLASSQAEPTALAVDASSVYWLTASAVIRANKKDGSSQVTLADHQFGPSAVALDAQQVYWTNFGDSSLSMVALGGGPIQPIATSLLGPLALAVDGEDIFVAEQGTGDNGFSDGAISRFVSGKKTAVASGQSAPQSLVVRDANLFWGNYNGGTVVTAPKDSGVPATLVSGQIGPSSVIADATFVYWSAQGKIWRVAR